MQKFYIYKDNTQQGPFSINELKELKITRDVMVWFEGAENWKKAHEIEELKEILKNTPPPLQANSPITPPPFVDAQKETLAKPKPKKKKIVLIVSIVASVILLCGIGVFIYISQQAEIAKLLQEQNAKIQEQEAIEAARQAEKNTQESIAREEARAAELSSLKAQHDEAITKLRAANLKLQEIEKFQLLRTASEKQQQEQKALEVIRSWENEVERLKNEIDKY